jgi:hypothetical protein
LDPRKRKKKKKHGEEGQRKAIYYMDQDILWEEAK